MPFREKSAWVSLLCTASAFGVYFVLLGHRLRATTEPPFLGLLLSCTVLLVAMQAALQAALAITTPTEARARPDERERTILLRSDQVSLAVLATSVGGVVVGIALARLPGPDTLVANALLLGLVLAALSKYAAQIVVFRRHA